MFDEVRKHTGYLARALSFRAWLRVRMPCVEGKVGAGALRTGLGFEILCRFGARFASPDDSAGRGRLPTPAGFEFAFGPGAAFAVDCASPQDGGGGGAGGGMRSSLDQRGS